MSDLKINMHVDDDEKLVISMISNNDNEVANERVMFCDDIRRLRKSDLMKIIRCLLLKVISESDATCKSLSDKTNDNSNENCENFLLALDLISFSVRNETAVFVKPIDFLLAKLDSNELDNKEFVEGSWPTIKGRLLSFGKTT